MPFAPGKGAISSAEDTFFACKQSGCYTSLATELCLQTLTISFCASVSISVSRFSPAAGQRWVLRGVGAQLSSGVLGFIDGCFFPRQT